MKIDKLKLDLDIPWMTLSNLGNSKIVRSSYVWMIIIPVVAKVFEKISPEIKLNIFNQIFHLSLTLPFGWKALYYSSLLFALGTIIYQMLCPRIIKEYSTYGAFIEDHQDSSYIVSEALKFYDFPNKYMDHTDLTVPMRLDQYRDLFTMYEVFTGRDGITHAKEIQESREGKTDESDVDGYIQEALYEYKGGSKEILLADYGIRLAIFDYLLERLHLNKDRESRAFWFTWNNANFAKKRVRTACALIYFCAFLFLAFVIVQNFLSVI